MPKRPMSDSQISKAKLRLHQLHAQLGALGPLMRGTIVTNGRKHPQPYFSLNKDHKTHLIYLGQRRLPAAKRMSATYATAIQIIEEMTIINMALLRNDVTH
jgi:hypothetical protein